jgi:hypothetical protein
VETSDKITQLENEIKVLKNEVQAVLLDIRENVLNAENPFTAQKPVVTSQVVIDRQVQAPAPAPAPVSESKVAPAPTAAAAPAPAPVPVQPVQEEKPAKSVKAKETNTQDYNEPEHNHNGNGRKPADMFEMEHNHNGNGRKPQEYNREDYRQPDQAETDLPRFEICQGRQDRRQPDLVAYASLACWVEDSTRRLGKERTQALLEISEVAGFLPADVKEILARLTNIKSTEHSYKPTARDYFDSLVKLSAVFGNNNDYNAALLLVLAQGDVRG